MAFSIRAELGAGQVPTLYIFDTIGGDGAGGGVTIAGVQKFLDDNRGAPEIRVLICSTGGDAYAALAIYDAIMKFPGKVTTQATGVVASAATTIFMAGAVREIAANCDFMIHEAWTETSGRAADMQAAEATLRRANQNMASIYSQRTGQGLPQVKKWMADETWFSPQDAKTFGFATAVTGAVQASVSGDLSRFKNIPARVAARLSKPNVAGMAGQPKTLADLLRSDSSDSDTEARHQRLKNSLLAAADANASGSPLPRSAEDLHVQNGKAPQAPGAKAAKTLADVLRMPNSPQAMQA